MFSKIDYHTCLQQYPQFPWSDHAKEKWFFPKTTDAGLIFTLESRSARGHARALGIELDKLYGLMNIDRLIFMPASKRPWRYQNNLYKAVQEAYSYLKQNKISKAFDGAIEITATQRRDFFRHVFWLVRCNISMPITHFMDPQQTIVATLCQYGSLHIYTLSPDAGEALRKAQPQTNFLIQTGIRCESPWSKTSKIPNRTINL